MSRRILIFTILGTDVLVKYVVVFSAIVQTSLFRFATSKSFSRILRNARQPCQAARLGSRAATCYHKLLVCLCWLQMMTCRLSVLKEAMFAVLACLVHAAARTCECEVTHPDEARKNRQT